MNLYTEINTVKVMNNATKDKKRLNEGETCKGRPLTFTHSYTELLVFPITGKVEGKGLSIQHCSHGSVNDKKPWRC